MPSLNIPIKRTATIAFVGADDELSNAVRTSFTKKYIQQLRFPWKCDGDSFEYLRYGFRYFQPGRLTSIGNTQLDPTMPVVLYDKVDLSEEDEQGSISVKLSTIELEDGIIVSQTRRLKSS
mgnify:CR=1 FL=1|tara:strand:+ start:2392 stop:2754 length:363 start_codon:yes stop_codon:yes gene_type:complete